MGADTLALIGLAILGLAIGSFLNAVVAFLLKAAGLYFMIVLPYNRFAARMTAATPPPAPPAPSSTEVLLTEIRDLLRQGR